jgi:hypothetical protein
MGKKLHVALFIIGIAVAIAIAVLPFILEDNGMKVPLWMWYFLEILAALMIVGTLIWLYWEKVKRVSSYICRLRLTLKPEQGHKDVSTRFSVKEDVLNPLEAMCLENKKRISELVLVLKQSMSLYINTYSGGIIEFSFEVFNGSILTIILGHQIDGSVSRNGFQFHDKAEIKNPITLLHGQKEILRISQPLLPNESQEIDKFAQTENGVNLRFELEGLKITIGKDNQVLGYLSFVSRMKFNIKNDRGYTWKPIT